MMFWRKRRRQAPTTAAPTVIGHENDSVPVSALPTHSYDDSDYWERERLDPWAATRRAQEEAWTQRRAVDAERGRAVAEAARTAGQCEVDLRASAPYYAGFLPDTGLIAPAEFDSRVEPEARLVMVVDRVPVAFDARDVIRSMSNMGGGNGAGLFQSRLVTCLMDGANVARTRALAKVASEREIARSLFQTPRVEAVMDPFGVWGIAAARPDRREAWVLPQGGGGASPRTGRSARELPARPTGTSFLRPYDDMYSSADDIQDEYDAYTDKSGQVSGVGHALGQRRTGLLHHQSIGVRDRGASYRGDNLDASNDRDDGYLDVMGGIDVVDDDDNDDDDVL